MTMITIIYAVVVTVCAIVYAWYAESRLSDARLERDVYKADNEILDRKIAQQSLVIQSASRGWLRSGGGDPTATTEHVAISPVTPIPPGRKIRQLTKLPAFAPIELEHMKTAPLKA